MNRQLRSPWIRELFRSRAHVLSGLALAGACAVSSAAPLDFHVISDSSWKTSAIATDGWEELSFDDSGWANARDPYPSPSSTSAIPGSESHNIWHDPLGTSNGATGPLEAYFRKSFILGVPPRLFRVRGSALLSVDDDYELYVNGRLAFGNHDGGYAHVVDYVDFTPLLRYGLNVFAIHAVDGGWGSPWDRSYERVTVDAYISAVPEPGLPSLIGVTMLAGYWGRRRLARAISRDAT